MGYPVVAAAVSAQLEAQSNVSTGIPTPWHPQVQVSFRLLPPLAEKCSRIPRSLGDTSL